MRQVIYHAAIQEIRLGLRFFQNPRTNLRRLRHCADLDGIAALAACADCSIMVRADTGALMARLSVVTCNWSEPSAWHADMRPHCHPHRWPAVSAAGGGRWRR